MLYEVLARWPRSRQTAALAGSEMRPTLPSSRHRWQVGRGRGGRVVSWWRLLLSIWSQPRPCICGYANESVQLCGSWRVRNSAAARVRLCKEECATLWPCVSYYDDEPVGPWSCVCDYAATRVQLSRLCVSYYNDECVHLHDRVCVTMPREVCNSVAACVRL